MTVRFNAAGALALILGLTACGESPVDTGAGRTGRFTLRQINGRQLPAVVADGNLARVIIHWGALRLRENGIFVDSTDLEFTNKVTGVVTSSMDVASGLYTVSHDTVFFRSVNRPGEHYFMVYASDRSLLQELGSALLLYSR